MRGRRRRLTLQGEARPSGGSTEAAEDLTDNAGEEGDEFGLPEGLTARWSSPSEGDLGQERGCGWLPGRRAGLWVCTVGSMGGLRGVVGLPREVCMRGEGRVGCRHGAVHEEVHRPVRGLWCACAKAEHDSHVAAVVEMGRHTAAV